MLRAIDVAASENNKGMFIARMRGPASENLISLL